jgi:hypothetical protein
MNTTKLITTLAAVAGILLFAAAAVTRNLVSLPTTFEFGFAILVIATLGSLAISEYRKGTPRRVTGVGLRRLPRQRFWA